jgi:leucyl-tRNA synthetase
VVRKKDRMVRVGTGSPVTIGRSEKMSKSKKNVVEPADIVDTYGVDAARWFMVSDSPPDRDLEWTDAGAEGAWRFIQKLWRLVVGIADDLPLAESPCPDRLSDPALALRRATHKAILAVTRDIEDLRFNTAVAQIYELTNTLTGFVPQKEDPIGDLWAVREGLDALVRLFAPMMPHLAEELWAMLGHSNLVANSDWPQGDPALLEQITVTIAVQVGGKLRATLEVARDLEKSEIEAAALGDAKVIKAINGRDIRKVIVVPNKIVNVVV